MQLNYFFYKISKYNLRLVISFFIFTSSNLWACDLDRPIVFAGLDWQSNAFHTEVFRLILELGLDCKTEIIPGTTIPLLQGVAKGDIDIVMEVWKDNVNKVWEKALDRNQVIEVGLNFSDAKQGWFVPKYMVEGDEAEAPGLISVDDLKKYNYLFSDPEEPLKGRFYNCIAGWNCEIINSAKLSAYGLNEYFTNFRPGTAAALSAAISSAYKRKAPILAYYWEPTWLLGVYDMVPIKEPEFNKSIFKNLSIQKNPKKATAYPVLDVYIGVNKIFFEDAPQIINILKNYRTESSLINEMLVYMYKDKLPARKVAKKFLETYPEYWRKWVSDSEYNKINVLLDISYDRK